MRAIRKILLIVGKNFKLLARSKTSALVIFLGPLLLVSLLGMAYSKTSDFALTAAVYSESYSDLTHSLLDKLKGKNFDVQRYPSIESCTHAVKRGDAQACVQFPENMKVQDGKTNEITFYVDYSQINLVWMLLDTMNAGVQEKSKEISKELTTDVLNRMAIVEDKLKLGKAKLAEIKADHANLKSSVGAVKDTVAQLDISVDFSAINITEGKSQAEKVLTQYTATQSKIRAELVSAMNKTTAVRKDLEKIKSNVSGPVQTQIDTVISDLKSAEKLMNSTQISVSADITVANVSVISIKNNFDSINEKLIAAQTKLTAVKKSRDDLLVTFDSVTAEIDATTTRVGDAQKLIDDSLGQISTLQVKNPSQIVNPFTTKISPVSVERSHFGSLFPTLLVLIIMSTGILFAAILVIGEKKSRAFLRNSITPTPFSTFAAATYLTGFLVLLLQLVLFVSVSVVFFQAQLHGNVSNVLLLLFLTISLFIFIGMLVGFLFSNEETVTLAAITLVTLFLLFSNTVIPLESLPGYLKSIAAFNPFVLSEALLKQTVLFSLGIETMAKQVFILTGYGLGMFALLILLQNSLRRIAYLHFWHFQFGETKKAKIALTMGNGMSPPEKPKDEAGSGNQNGRGNQNEEENKNSLQAPQDLQDSSRQFVPDSRLNIKKLFR